MVAIAIDLGTTYTCAAVWKNNKVEVITNEQGNRFTPSYVAFSNKERLIGEAAKNQASFNPNNTIFGAKRLIGRRYDDVNLQMDLRRFPYSVVNCKGKPKIVVHFKGKKLLFAPEEISAMIIFRMKQMAEDFLGCKVTSAVITVPAYFNDSQRQATRLAGAIAELDVIRIINEPTAAALMYGMNEKLCKDKNVLVFDLGGGTLDVSILTIGDGSVYEVRATSGNSRLGGEDFENRLISYFVQDFLKLYGKEIKQARSLRRLKAAAEKVKCCLTSANEAKFQIESMFNDINYCGRVSRVLFEDLCSDLFEDTLKPVERALKNASMLKKDINNVILVGGSSRIPKIKKLLSDFFGSKILTCSINPDEAIACGAAIQAAILSGDNEGIKNLLLIDVVPLSLGVETARGMMYKVIERNTPIPCQRVKDLTTLDDYQTSMTIEVFEGERALTKDNYLLGVFELDKIPPVPRGVAKIDIIFDIDSNGILTVSAKDKSTGNSESITIENKHRLTMEDMSKMISDARKFREEDVENKRRLEVRNQLETYIYDVKLSITENLMNLSGEECAFMIGECKNALTWLEENPDCLREEYERKLSELLKHWSGNIRKLNRYSVKRRKVDSEAEHQSTVIEEVVEDKS